MPTVNLSHLFVPRQAEQHPFQSPQSTNFKVKLPARKVREHGRRLLARLRQLELREPNIRAQRTEAGLDEGGGTVIVLQVTPAKLFEPSKVEWKRDKIELLSFTATGNSGVAVLHVPFGSLKAFERRIEEYLVDPPDGGTRAHLKLISLIEGIREAEFTDLWTDADAPPTGTDVAWFQLWLRAHNTDAQSVYDDFKAVAPLFGIALDEGYVRFPGRVVVAVRGTRAQLEKAAGYLDSIAEIRGVQPTTGFFVSALTPAETAEWVGSLRERTVFADGADATRVTLLDTGVNTGHPLLAAAVFPGDTHAFDPRWGVHDHEGHGTEMAGISLYGNLTVPLASQQPLLLSHRLESVKIWPPQGQNPPHLYGSIMWQAAGHVEVRNPHAKRVFAMMTTEEGVRFGMPTEWSATLDQMAFGRMPIQVGLNEQPSDRTPRLFVLAGGNVPVSEWNHYPATNHLTGIKSPGQSWNAITVGACTNLVDLDATTYPSLSAIAKAGELAPCSSTAVTWQSRWPHKPDVVAEGGNGAIEAGLHVVDGPEDLRLLTTSHEPAKRLLAETGGTSAASAEVARLCAMLTAQYPDYWPETVRGLVVHGARYTAPMLKQQAEADDQTAKQTLLRTYGFGLVGTDNFASPQEALRYFNSISPVSTLFDGMFIVGLDGRISASFPHVQGVVGLDVHDRDYFKEVVIVGQPTISSPLRNRVGGAPNIVFAAPIFDDAGRITGVFCASLGLLRPNFLGDLRNMRIGANGYVFVVQRGNHPMFVIHPDDNKLLAETTIEPAIANALAEMPTDDTGPLVITENIIATGWTLGSWPLPHRQRRQHRIRE